MADLHLNLLVRVSRLLRSKTHWRHNCRWLLLVLKHIALCHHSPQALDLRRLPHLHKALSHVLQRKKDRLSEENLSMAPNPCLSNLLHHLHWGQQHRPHPPKLTRACDHPSISTHLVDHLQCPLSNLRREVLTAVLCKVTNLTLWAKQRQIICPNRSASHPQGHGWTRGKLLAS